MVPRHRSDDRRAHELAFLQRWRRCDVEAIELVRDERGGLPVTVAEEQTVETAVFPPDDSNFFARDESEPERRSPFGLHQREQIAVLQARFREQAGDGIAILDLEPGRLRAGGRGESRNAEHPMTAESERRRAPTPQVRRELRQGPHGLEGSCDSGILGAGQRLALRAVTTRPS